MYAHRRSRRIGRCLLSVGLPAHPASSASPTCPSRSTPGSLVAAAESRNHTPGPSRDCAAVCGARPDLEQYDAPDPPVSPDYVEKAMFLCDHRGRSSFPLHLCTSYRVPVSGQDRRHRQPVAHGTRGAWSCRVCQRANSEQAPRVQKGITPEGDRAHAADWPIRLAARGVRSGLEFFSQPLPIRIEQGGRPARGRIGEGAQLHRVSRHP